MSPDQRKTLIEFLMSVIENSFEIHIRVQAATLLVELENS